MGPPSLSTIAPVLFAGLPALALLAFFLARHNLWRIPRPAAWPRILMYHRVTTSAPPDGMNTPPALFEKHLEILKAQGKVFCTVSEMADRLRAGGQGCDHLVALTFDDGWRDNFEEMFPVLKKHGAKATIYLATEYASIPLLTPEQIREMSASGLVEFGAHTLHHVNLTVTAPEEALREISGSRAATAALSGVPCRSFAYPYGRFEQSHVEMVRQAGFDTAVSTKKKLLPWAEQDPLRLLRISVNGASSLWQFKIALSRGRYRI